MTNEKVTIRRLATGVPGLDELLGGGLPEFSFNLLAGTPGSGKTTLAHQIMFSLASPGQRALFFTVLGESPLKMLRYQQQFPFFDVLKVNQSIRFVNLAADLLDGDFERVLERINEEVQNFAPSLVFVDSFRSVVQSAKTAETGVSGLARFVQQLGMHMASWQATTFLIGEYMAPEVESSAVFTVADGIIWMSQLVYHDVTVRKIQVVKMRGQAQSPGVHTFRITGNGVAVFPRALLEHSGGVPSQGPDLVRLPTGVPQLDEMLGGGLPRAYALLVVGPSGSGKTVLATRFLAEGVRLGEPGVIVAFEKTPNQWLNPQLSAMVQSGTVGVINTRRLDLSIDEILHDLVQMISHMKARRVVIDSLSGFEMAIASVFREDFRDALYRMVSVLIGMDVTIVMTAELEDQYNTLRFSSYGNAFLADAIVMQRYAELGGQLRRVISVVKVRASNHSKDIRFFDIDGDNILIGAPLGEYHGILTGHPVKQS